MTPSGQRWENLKEPEDEQDLNEVSSKAIEASKGVTQLHKYKPLL